MLHGFAFSGATLLIGLQVYVALLWDHEGMITRPKCACPWDLVRAKQQWSVIVASTLLIVWLWLQQKSVAYDEEGRCEFHGDQKPLANERLMLSWSVLVISMFCVAMFAVIMPGVQWWMRADYARAEASENTRTEPSRSKAARMKAAHSCVQQASDCCGSCKNKARDLKLAYAELFSYKRGRYYMLKCVVMEFVEVYNQTTQLVSFSHERPMEWISGLSVILVLNGLLVPVPFVVMRLAPGWDKAARLILAWIDITFDTGCLLITILHSKKSEFLDKNWWIATSGVVVPIARIIWRSTRLAVAKETTKPSSGHRIALVFSVLIAIFSIVTGGIFLEMAIDGDRACRGLLGDSLGGIVAKDCGGRGWGGVARRLQF
jgi:hypothetical protein